MSKRHSWFIAVAVTGMLLAGVAAAADKPDQWVPGELIVKFRPGVSSAAKSSLMKGRRVRSFRFIGAEHWKLDGGNGVEAAVAALEADPRVEYAEPNYVVHALRAPNDPLFDQLWGLRNTGQVLGGVSGIPDSDTDADEAWDLFTGSAAVLVAVLDTGIDYRHPDLAANIWTNPGEIAGNGIDDDGNGFIDDIHGWDFANNDSDPMDGSGHGSHVSGTIGGVADNGIGIAGVNWNVRMMALKFMNNDGTGTSADAISCIEYATMMGVDVMSNSWGNNSRSESMLAAIQAAYDANIFFVAGAGNSGADDDVAPFYPSSFDAGNVISVMATDNRDRRAVESDWSSSFGATTVDIAAPGVRIWSTIPNGSYMYLSGTSMAVPHVAGALALLRGRFPDITVDEGKFLLLNVGNDPLPGLFGRCVSGARLNLRKLIADLDTVPPAAVTDLAVLTAASDRVTLGWTTPADDRTLERYDLRYAPAPITDEAGWDSATRATAEPAPGVPGQPAEVIVEGLPVATTCYFSLRAADEYGNLGALSNSPGADLLPPPVITVAPASLSAAVSPGGAVTRTLTITNPSAGVLDFAIPRHSPARPGANLFTGAVAGTVSDWGRVDGFGYDWLDSDMPGAVDYNWVDISASGTVVSLPDDSSQGPFDLGFAFPFYGHDFTTFFINAHGCVNLAGVSTDGANVALPSAGAPGYFLALLWDRMTPGVGTCSYYSDGNRMIVQYTGVSPASAGGACTMQMHLYANGLVEYHYKTMTGPASESATIGIQNGDGSDGLTVAFDTAYVHDNLAIRFTPPPAWLSVTPDNGNLAPGTSLDLAVTFNSTGLCGSHFDGNLHVLSNDPARPCIIVPAGLDIAGEPDIGVSPASLSFGAVRQSESATRHLTVLNHGCGDLTILGLGFNEPSFASTQALPLMIKAGARADVTVTFSPSVASAISGTLTLASDDPDSPVLAVPLSGTGALVPDIALSPTSLAETIPTGGTSTRQLTISNNGLVNLAYSFAAPEYISATDKGAGGPDAFNYRWTDRDDSRGPIYTWIEIKVIGQKIDFDASGLSGPCPIGFGFPFYGNSFSAFWACIDGWISFASAPVPTDNTDLPSTLAPPNLIAPYWDDMVFGNVYYYNDGQRLIVEFENMSSIGSAAQSTFQVHIYPRGRIEYHYKSMPTVQGGATIGIQDATRAVGLRPSYNTIYARSIFAVRFENQPLWLSSLPAAGTVAAGSSVAVPIGFDGTGLCGGAYGANLRVRSNDPDSPETVLPVTLTALDAPDARFAPAQPSFGSVYVTRNALRTVNLVNIGCAPLQVSGVSIDNPAFSCAVTGPFTVAVGASRLLDITFAPVASGYTSGTLTLVTTDAFRPTLTVPLVGTGINPPVMSVTPDAINRTVRPAQQQAATIHLANSGAGPLQFSITSPALYDKAATMAGADSSSGLVGALSPQGNGGPDGYGYRWTDSDAPYGPAFSWIDIAGTGTVALASGNDAGGGPFPIGFDFTFYGTRFSTFRVSSEGFLAFSPISSFGGNNMYLPSVSAPRNLVAPFWDDLDLDAPGSGDIWYKNVDGNLVVQWDHVMRAGSTSPVTFEAIVKPSGAIVFQYLSVGAAVTTSATVGIQNATGLIGLPVVYNSAYLHDNLAVQLRIMPKWATVSPMSGTIAAGGGADLTLTLNASGMDLGLHHAQVSILSNDLDHPTVAIPVTMNVLDYAAGDGIPLPSVLSLGQNFPNPFNPGTLIRFQLPAEAPVDLRIYDVRGCLIRTIARGLLAAGAHDYLWDGRGDDDVPVASGIYFYRLRAGDDDLTRSMTLVR